MKKATVIPVFLFSILSLVGFLDANGQNREPSGPIYNGSELDYQPAVIRMEPSGDLMVVFERLNPSTLFGDLYVTFSSDSGQTWTVPQAIIQTSYNERHPALVQMGPSSFALFYLVDETGSGDYRIHRATSSNGILWTSQGVLDLDWAAPGEINPCVIREADGTLTMTYHRIYGSSYIAQSTDQGVTWDQLKTQVSTGKGALPRLTKRESDGLYLVTYQTGSTSVDVWAKVSFDPHDWPVGATPLSTAINSHDSQPMVMEGGTFLVTYAQQVASVFDLYYKTSYDGVNWSEAVRITTDPQHYDTQPHPLREGTPGHVILTWSHQDSPTPYVDHDVWADIDLFIPLSLWLDGDALSAATGGSIGFFLDAGTAYAGREYLLLGSLSGTSPGTPLPGGGRLAINYDPFTTFILIHIHNPIFTSFLGYLDPNGRALATLNVGGPIPLTPGTLLHFAYTTAGPFDFQSNPQGVTINP
jgi:hypothetical protein